MVTRRHVKPLACAWTPEEDSPQGAVITPPAQRLYPDEFVTYLSGAMIPSGVVSDAGLYANAETFIAGRTPILAIVSCSA